MRLLDFGWRHFAALGAVCLFVAACNGDDGDGTDGVEPDDGTTVTDGDDGTGEADTDADTTDDSDATTDDGTDDTDDTGTDDADTTGDETDTTDDSTTGDDGGLVTCEADEDCEDVEFDTDTLPCDRIACIGGYCVNNAAKICLEEDGDACTEPGCDEAIDACVETPIEDCATCDGAPTIKCITNEDGTCNEQWCDLTETACNPLNPQVCIDAAKGEDDEWPTFPDCLQPGCHPDADKCYLVPIEGCCTSIGDCSTNACYVADCQPETDKPAHLENSQVEYCVDTPLEECCADDVADNEVADQQFGTYPNLPDGWSVKDTNTSDWISWHPTGDASECYNGLNTDDGCMRVGYFKSTAPNDPNAVACYIYSSNPIDESECEETSIDCEDDGDCDAYPGTTCVTGLDGTKGCRGSAINVVLRSKAFDLSTPDVPWLLSFRLKMDTEPPDGGLAGDAVRAVVVPQDGPEETVFDSATSLGNDTDGEYALVAVDLSDYAGQSITIELRFVTADSFANTGQGVFLDDFTLGSQCGAPQCTQDEDCPAADNACEERRCALVEPANAYSGATPHGFCTTEEKDPTIPCTDCALPDNPCPGGLDCVDGICLPPCEPTPIASEDFEDELDDEWDAFGDGFCGNFWTITSNRASGGASSIHFGKIDAACDEDETPICGGGAIGDICPDYNCGENDLITGTLGTVTTAEYTLPQTHNNEVYFDVFLTTEYDQTNFDPALCAGNPAACYDRLSLWWMPKEGDEIPVWDSLGILTPQHTDANGTTKCDWQSVTAVVPKDQKGLTGQFQFRFDSLEDFNDFEGPYIDNFSVMGTCGLPGCQAVGECDDEEPCTEDACFEGECIHTPIDDCCATDEDCAQFAGDCQDFACVDKGCEYSTDISAGGCCQQDFVYGSWDFEGGLPETWTIEDTPEGYAPAVLWHYVEGIGAGGTAGLAFANPDTGNYNAPGSPVKGRFQTAPIAVPPGGQANVAFDVWLSTEFNDYDSGAIATYQANLATFFLDRLSAWVPLGVECEVVGGNDPCNLGQCNFGECELMVWRSDDGVPLAGTSKGEPQPDGTATVGWQTVAFSIEQFGGSEVPIVFEFDSNSADSNSYAGPVIDNIRVTQACTPGGCLADPYCWDGLYCSVDTCVAGECVAAENDDPICCFPTPQDVSSWDGGAEDAVWTTSDAADGVGWHVSDLKSADGTSSMRFGRIAGEDYSACTCLSPPKDICSADEATCANPVCPEAEPAGTLTSPEFTVTKGEDYSIAFSLFADLSLAEGSFGLSEDFTVKLMRKSVLGDQDVVTLLCHGGECQDPGFDPCKSGIAFEFPGCDDPTGDYHKWIQREFVLSDVLCDANTLGSSGFLDTLATGSATFYVKVEFNTYGLLDDCGQGLFIDAFSFNKVCSEGDEEGWDGTCE